MKNPFSKAKNVHFIGIGGSGMCAIAEILLNRGYKITGSDNYNSDTLRRMRSLGISVTTKHSAENIKNTDLIIYSAAIKPNNPELIFAREKNMNCLERSVVLGILMSEYKNTIAISGTHGKTTTTAMTTQIFFDAKTKPTAVIGGYLPSIKSNALIGESETIICEACEYVDTFLQLHPKTAVLLNIEADHLDYFKNFKNLKLSFEKFVRQIKSKLIANGDDTNVLEIAKNTDIDLITFGFSRNNSYQAKFSLIDKKKSTFSVFLNDKKLFDIHLKIPGIHNTYNALASIAVAYENGIKLSDIKKSLENFVGVHRRFEILGKINNITIADDFAHHPTELRLTLNTATNLGYKRVIAIFQPHTYSRTYTFLSNFADALSIADKVIISQILPVREKNIYNIHAEDLAKKINESVWFETFEEITNYILKNAKPNDLVITLGGGNIYVCANMILEALKFKKTV
ncbi:MAG: UDP-N-acetylmuramate--L-alanine ligase [Oscillospiraceae bacterium]|nr:UDP-N-acetylmuramate--L-alanine ligase [Oscillospiraceae bacterium]